LDYEIQKGNFRFNVFYFLLNIEQKSLIDYFLRRIGKTVKEYNTLGAP